jgi:4a-hydroxytetrahydrobiopterin dehydratase
MPPALNLEALLKEHSKPLEGSAGLDAASITRQLEELPEWQFKDGAIERALSFQNYYETMAFINALAYVVHDEDHHPDISFGYNRIVVRFNTHSVNGVSINDFICAAKCDALYTTRHSHAT